MQLAAYALLVEDVMGRPVPAGFIYLAPRNQLVRVNITPGLIARVRQTMIDIRSMIQEAILPDPTPVRARCEECEFRNYCGDVF